MYFSKVLKLLQKTARTEPCRKLSHRLVRKENQHKLLNDWKKEPVDQGYRRKSRNMVSSKSNEESMSKKSGHDQLYPMLQRGTDKELSVRFSNLEYILLKKPDDYILPHSHPRRHDYILSMLSFSYLMNWIFLKNYPKERIYSSLIFETQIRSFKKYLWQPSDDSNLLIFNPWTLKEQKYL